LPEGACLGARTIPPGSGREEETFYRAADHRFLKEAEAGVPVKALCRKHGFSDAAFYGWRAKFGGLPVNEAKRLRAINVAGSINRLRFDTAAYRCSGSVSRLTAQCGRCYSSKNRG